MCICVCVRMCVHVRVSVCVGKRVCCFTQVARADFTESLKRVSHVDIVGRTFQADGIASAKPQTRPVR